jgi:hypothetical protein
VPVLLSSGSCEARKEARANVCRSQFIQSDCTVNKDLVRISASKEMRVYEKYDFLLRSIVALGS